MYNMGFKPSTDSLTGWFYIHGGWPTLGHVNPRAGVGVAIAIANGRLDTWTGTRFICVHTPSVNVLCFFAVYSMTDISRRDCYL